MATIPILREQITELERKLEEERAEKAALRERLSELRAVFRILLTTLEEGARDLGEAS